MAQVRECAHKMLISCEDFSVIALWAFLVAKFRSPYADDIVIPEKVFLHPLGIDENAVLAAPVDYACYLAFNNDDGMSATYVLGL